jgi:hypothetical protein
MTAGTRRYFQADSGRVWRRSRRLASSTSGCGRGSRRFARHPQGVSHALALRLLTSDADRRAIESDLAELHELQRQQHGARAADRWLRRQHRAVSLASVSRPLPQADSPSDHHAPSLARHPLQPAEPGSCACALGHHRPHGRHRSGGDERDDWPGPRGLVDPLPIRGFAGSRLALYRHSPYRIPFFSVVDYRRSKPTIRRSAALPPTRRTSSRSRVADRQSASRGTR